MELKVIREGEKEIFLELRGETVTLTNLIRDELWSFGASEAAHVQEHPYLAEPKIFCKVSTGSPRKALEKVAKKIQKSAEKFKEEFKAALK